MPRVVASELFPPPNYVKAGSPLRRPPLDQPVADEVPESAVLTRYDQEHLATYLRLYGQVDDGHGYRRLLRSTQLPDRLSANPDPAEMPRLSRPACWESAIGSQDTGSPAGRRDCRSRFAGAPFR